MTVDELIKKLQDIPAHYEVKFMYNNSDLLYGFIDHIPCKVASVQEDKTNSIVELREEF